MRVPPRLAIFTEVRIASGPNPCSLSQVCLDLSRREMVCGRSLFTSMRGSRQMLKDSVAFSNSQLPGPLKPGDLCEKPLLGLTVNQSL